MKMLVKIMLITMMAVPLVSMASATAPKQITLQVEPGSNPNRVNYDKIADITVNGTNIGEKVEITQNSTPQTRDLSLHELQTGETITVDAIFSNRDTSHAVTCSRSWPVVSENSIGCGPIEASYQAITDTCVLTCN